MPRFSKLLSLEVFRRFVTGPVAAFLLAGMAQLGRAAPLVWDSGNTSNGATIDAAGGAWSTSAGSQVWNDSGVNKAWTGVTNSAVFAGADGNYSITVSNAVSATNLWFQNSGYAFSAPSAQVISVLSSAGASTPQLRVDGGKMVAIGANITIQNGPATGLFIGANGGTAGGTVNINNGGTIKQNSSNSGGVDGSGTIVNINTGGVFSGPDNGGTSGQLTIGNGGGSSSTVNVAGGSIYFGSGKQPLNVGGNGAGFLNINSGTVALNAGATNGLQLASGGSGVGTVNLTGGILTVPLIKPGLGNSTFNFNGGRLVANKSATNFLTGLTAVNVRNGGAMVDTAGFDIAINQSLPHSVIGGDNATDGGLTKLGIGTLTLGGANTYTGPTWVSNGTLEVTGSLKGSVVVGSSGTLSTGPDVRAVAVSNNLSLAGTTLMKIDKTSGLTNDLIQGLAAANYGGTLILTLVGGNLSAGDVFTLFKAGSYSGSFAQIIVQPAQTNGLTFDATNLTVNGSVRVITNTAPPFFVGAIQTSAGAVFAGGALVLGATVTGGLPMSYQWQLNGVNIPGATDASLALSGASAADAGNYTLIAANASGTVTNLFPASVKVIALTLDATQASDGLQVAYDTMPLYQYQLLAATNLAGSQNSWSNFGPALHGNGNRFSQIIPATNGAARFASFVAAPSPISAARFPVEPWKDTQWNDPGGWTTINVATQGLPANSTNLDAAAKIAQIIQGTTGRRRLYFPAGVYAFKSTLTITNSDLWLEGDGTNTVFRIDAASTVNAQILFVGNEKSPLAVVGSLAVGGTMLTLANAGSISVGDIIQLYADNAPLTNTGQAWDLQIYSQNFRVVGKVGNTLLLDMKILLPYDASLVPMVKKLVTVKNVKVQHLKVDRLNEPTIENISNLEFLYAYNCCVQDIESNFSGRTHIGFENSKDCVITRNFVHDCWEHTTGGFGYGYNLVATTGCRIANNKAARLRHEVIVSIGANHNVISYNSIEEPYDYNDCALHSVFAYMNLFEANMFDEGYADSSKDGWPDIEATTGPGNTWFRNFATGVVGSKQSGTTRQNVMGNYAGSIGTQGADHYVGANNVANVTNWGVFSASTVLPASLYLGAKPEFLSANMPWPLFGPGVPKWGTTNTLPARSGIPLAP